MKFGYPGGNDLQLAFFTIERILRSQQGLARLSTLSVRYENGCTSVSGFCSSSMSHFILDFASRGGVPVLRRPSWKLAWRSEAERPVGGEAASSMRPAGYVSSPKRGQGVVSRRWCGRGGKRRLTDVYLAREKCPSAEDDARAGYLLASVCNDKLVRDPSHEQIAKISGAYQAERPQLVPKRRSK